MSKRIQKIHYNLTESALFHNIFPSMSLSREERVKLVDSKKKKVHNINILCAVIRLNFIKDKANETY